MSSIYFYKLTAVKNEKIVSDDVYYVECKFIDNRLHYLYNNYVCICQSATSWFQKVPEIKVSHLHMSQVKERKTQTRDSISVWPPVTQPGQWKKYADWLHCNHNNGTGFLLNMAWLIKSDVFCLGKGAPTCLAENRKCELSKHMVESYECIHIWCKRWLFLLLSLLFTYLS